MRDGHNIIRSARIPKPVVLVDTREKEPFPLFLNHPNWIGGERRVALKTGDYTVEEILPDGTYVDQLSQSAIRVSGGKLRLPEAAVVLCCTEPLILNPVFCELLDYHVPAE